jgi:LemA protein
MNGFGIFLLILLGTILGFIFYIIAIYNKLVRMRNQYTNSFSQIDIQLKRRYDLIPNLVETAKAYLAHERKTLEAVIAARNSAMTASKGASAGHMGGMIQAEAGLSQALGRMFALSESYPDLKANQTMAQLTEELTTTENKISFARQAYNDTVMTYNTAIESFPDLLVARPFNFTSADLWEIEEAIEREPVKVSFN